MKDAKVIESVAGSTQKCFTAGLNEISKGMIRCQMKDLLGLIESNRKMSSVMDDNCHSNPGVIA